MLQTLALSDVDDRGDHELAVARLDRVETDLDRELGPIVMQGVELMTNPHRALLRR